MYFSLRLTPSFTDPSNCDASMNVQLFYDIIEHYKVQSYVICYEELNKYLEPCAPHYHFNFVCDEKKNTIAKYITRYKPFKIKGKSAYSLSASTDINLIRWWRYCLKENPLYWANLPIDVIKQTLLSQDERQQTAIFNKERRDSKKSTLFTRVCSHLDGKVEKLTSTKRIWIEILKYYMDNDLSINRLNIMGLTHLYMLKKGMITPHLLWNTWNISSQS